MNFECGEGLARYASGVISRKPNSACRAGTISHCPIFQPTQIPRQKSTKVSQSLYTQNIRHVLKNMNQYAVTRGTLNALRFSSRPFPRHSEPTKIPLYPRSLHHPLDSRQNTAPITFTSASHAYPSSLRRSFFRNGPNDRTAYLDHAKSRVDFTSPVSDGNSVVRVALNITQAHSVSADRLRSKTDIYGGFHTLRSTRPLDRRRAFASTAQHYKSQSKSPEKIAEDAKQSAKAAAKATAAQTSNKHLIDRLPHMPQMPHIHRPTKEELLAAATGFWSRLKVRFKWFSIRSVRPFNIDEISGFLSWLLVGHVLWIVLGTTTFFSLAIFACNTVFAQGETCMSIYITLPNRMYRDFSRLDRQVPYKIIWAQGGLRICNCP